MAAEQPFDLKGYIYHKAMIKGSCTSVGIVVVVPVREPCRQKGADMLKDIIENRKSLGEELETVSVRCKYCGQSMLAEVTAEMKNNQDILRELAIELCECVSAKSDTQRKRRVEQIDEKLNECIGEGSESPVDDEIFQVIQKTAKLVCFGTIDKANFKLNEIEKVSLRTDSNGLLHVDREKKKKTSRTI